MPEPTTPGTTAPRCRDCINGQRTERRKYTSPADGHTSQHLHRVTCSTCGGSGTRRS